MEFIAHQSEDKRIQTVFEHLCNTAQRAKEFGQSFGCEQDAYRCGILHDIGKYSAAFQKRIHGSNIKTDHSTAGAQTALKEFKDILGSLCIAGHHGGLPNVGSPQSSDNSCYFARMAREVEPYQDWVCDIDTRTIENPRQDRLRDRQKDFFYVHMLYSCLVDADFLDTESFMSPSTCRPSGESIESLKNKLLQRLELFSNPQNELNRARTEILNSVQQKAVQNRGIYSLTVPTGGGKTLTSMAYALEHAATHDMRRIIYVIPYVSIIEQTYAVFADLFGADNVLAHYCTADFANDENEKSLAKLASENWDGFPIILTTAVQFFESLFSNKPSACRKLHNIANSVIIFDEAQMLPVPHLTPCIYAISELYKNYGCSAVLCTATQPSLAPFFKKFTETEITELCPPPLIQNDIFDRVRFQHDGILDDAQIAAILNTQNQVLCILNNRRQAQKIYEMLESEGSYHLSTAMTANDRTTAVAQIKNALKQGRPCKVVATSIVEAGVDFSFPLVYRAEAGLDSILQAAGRCNREGKSDKQHSVVHLFQPTCKSPDSMLPNIAASRHIFANSRDFGDANTIKQYFDFLFSVLKSDADFDIKKIMQEIPKLPFQTISESFHLIENGEFSLFIPYGDAKPICEQLIAFGPSRSLMRKLGPYSVGVYPKHFHNLICSGAAVLVCDNCAVLQSEQLYSHKTGLSLDFCEGLDFSI